MEKPVTKTYVMLVIFASIAGLFLSIYATNNSINAFKSKNWPTTEGTIISSEVGRESRYVPKVKYIYMVDSTEFVSEMIRLTRPGQYKSKDDAAMVAAKYPVDSKVKVYYNPNKLDEAILDPGIKGEHIFMFFLGFIIFLAPLLGLIYTIRSSRKSI